MHERSRGWMMKDWAQQIHERQAQMPKACRATYDKAMRGTSRKAAMTAFCAECMGWQVAEVFRCTDPGCPLYPYRPSSRSAQSASENSGEAVESTNGVEGG